MKKVKTHEKLIISVKSPSSIRVAVPRYISFRKAKALLHQKLEWIKKQQNNYSKIINASELVKSVSAREKSARSPGGRQLGLWPWHAGFRPDVQSPQAGVRQRGLRSGAGVRAGYRAGRRFAYRSQQTEASDAG